MAKNEPVGVLIFKDCAKERSFADFAWCVEAELYMQFVFRTVTAWN